MSDRVSIVPLMAQANSSTPKIISLTFRLPADLAHQLEQVARSADRSVSAELRQAVKAHVHKETA